MDDNKYTLQDLINYLEDSHGFISEKVVDLQDNKPLPETDKLKEILLTQIEEDVADHISDHNIDSWSFASMLCCFALKILQGNFDLGNIITEIEEKLNELNNE